MTHVDTHLGAAGERHDEGAAAHARDGAGEDGEGRVLRTDLKSADEFHVCKHKYVPWIMNGPVPSWLLPSYIPP